MPLVVIRESTYNEVSNVINEALKKFNMDFRNKTILVKPNMLCGASPNEHVTTHPSIIRAVVDFLINEGANTVYVGDIPGNQDAGNVLKVAETCGFMKASKGKFIDLTKETTYVNLGLESVDPIEIPVLPKKVDMIINIPKFKTHCRTFLTAAIKNMFGFVMYNDRQRIHKTSATTLQFAHAIVKVYEFFIPTLNIIDCIVCMEGNGPIGKELREINKVVISDDGVAADSVLAVMMGTTFDKIPILSSANSLGIGQVNMKDMRIDGKIEVIPDFKMPATFHIKGINEMELPIFSGNKISLKLNKLLCNKCTICVKRCPVNAIVMYEHPVIKSDICIGCYCCHELCPQSAWYLE